MTSRMRESVEKAAHVAVGAPVAAVKAMGARIGELREAVKTSRQEMGQDLANEIDEWIAEGERVIERAMSRVRSSEVAEDVEEGVQAAQAGITKARHRVERGLAPDMELTVVNGIGPSFASQLDDAGITGVVGFMSATGTKEDIAALAESTEFTPATLESWRNQLDLARVDGVGGAYKDLLHRVDIWTMSQLADADPEALVDAMGKLEAMPGTPDQMPSIYAVKQWVAEAKKLVK